MSDQRWLCVECGFMTENLSIGKDAVRHRDKLYHVPCFSTMKNFQGKVLSLVYPLVCISHSEKKRR